MQRLTLGVLQMDNLEIDKLVAEKVMGWEVAYFPDINIYEAYDEEKNSIIISGEFSPSSDIQDAWQAIQKFKQYEINQLGSEVLVRVWIGFRHFDVRGNYSVPMAICLAALKAFKVKV